MSKPRHEKPAITDGVRGQRAEPKSLDSLSQGQDGVPSPFQRGEPAFKLPPGYKQCRIPAMLVAKRETVVTEDRQPVPAPRRFSHQVEPPRGSQPPQDGMFEPPMYR